MWATSDKNTNINISRNLLCKVRISILYAVERFSSLFSKDKLKARGGTHTPTHDPLSPRMSLENFLAVPRLHTCMCCVELGFTGVPSLASAVGTLRSEDGDGRESFA